MKILSYIQSLLPSFKKDRVIEDIRLVRAEIIEHTGPSYKVATELLSKWKFKSPVLSKQISIFERMVKGEGNDNIVVTIDKSFKSILENLHIVENLINKMYNEEVVGKGFTYLKVNLLQFVEAVSFVSKFARRFLIYIYICETEVYPDSGTALYTSLSKAEIEWIEANFVSFCTALNIVTIKPNDLDKQFNNIPDIVVTNENVETLSSTLGEARLDPFQMKLIPIWLNPIYHIGMFVAEWQADRYKAAKEEVKLLQLRKLNLEKLSEGKPDAKLQKEIEYMEGRIQGLNYKLAKMEKDNGL
jgi:hypothetical protein